MRTGLALTAPLLATLFASSTIATAAPRLSSPRGFYVALDYDHATASSSSFDGGDVALGYRFNRRFGFEGGLLLSRVSGVALTSTYVEAQYLVGLWGNTSLEFSAGGAFATASASFGGGTFAGVSEGGYRLGVGFEERWSDRWTFRTSAHYQNALADVSIFAVGLSYRL